MTLASLAPASRPEEARYVPLVKIASGGMATVFVGALRGPLGFSQLVALKRPHDHLLEDESFRRALLEEARLAARIRHANVVDVRDIELVGSSIQLVMDYVEGATLGQLIAAAGRAGKRLSVGVVVRVVLDALAGLAAVHAARDESGARLGLVHRDISPQNILVGLDGLGRVTDFGIARAENAAYTPTTQGTLKGKLGYLAPEYVRGLRPDQRADVFAMGVVAWEALVGRRLFKGENEADSLDRLLHERAPLLSHERPEIGQALDDVLDKALAKAPEARFQSAAEFASALEEAARGAGYLATAAEVGREVREAVGEQLDRREQEVRAASAALATTRPAEGLPPPVLAAPAPSPRSSRMPLALAAASFVVAVAVGAAWLMKDPVQPSEAAGPSSALPVPLAASSAATAAAPPSAITPPAAPASPPAASAAPLASTPAPPRTLAAPARPPASTTKTKSRVLPPNPYGPSGGSVH